LLIPNLSRTVSAKDLEGEVAEEEGDEAAIGVVISTSEDTLLTDRGFWLALMGPEAGSFTMTLELRLNGGIEGFDCILFQSGKYLEL